MQANYSAAENKAGGLVQNERKKKRKQAAMRQNKTGIWRRIGVNYELYIFLIPAVVYTAIFLYGPMYGVLMAFKDYNMLEGVMGSPWVGLKHFQRFFQGYNFWSTLFNTLLLSLYYLAATLPLPVILAIIFNNVKNGMFKKSVQLAAYAPNFISVVVLVGIMKIVFAPDTGVFNIVIEKLFHVETADVFGRPEYFRHLYVWSGVWQTLGWNSIIYVAALTGISPELYEAFTVDGANRLQKIRYLELPSILPTVVIVLILNTGSIMNIGFEKVYLMQTPLNLSVSETLPTYLYKMGVINNDYGLATAVGFFNSAVSCILLVIVNTVAKKLGDSSLF
ncbi:MAG: sugar ABC transporter permease [Clostridia bacterium]|nr:sugar ABC transporter permease [Clostridia bacterium]